MSDCFTRSEMVNTSTLINKGKVIIEGIVISANGANGVVNIYDGLDANAEKKYVLCVVDGSTIPVDLNPAEEFDFGLYIEVNAATTFCTIRYRSK